MSGKKGWYTPNSVISRDIYPEYRTAGGGVSKSDLLPTRKKALEKAISLLNMRLRDTELCIRRIEKELGQEIGDGSQDNF